MNCMGNFYDTFHLFPQSVVSMDGDKLVHVQRWDGKETNFVREIKDDKMVMVSKVKNGPESLLCHRYYDRVLVSLPKYRSMIASKNSPITFCSSMVNYKTCDICHMRIPLQC